MQSSPNMPTPGNMMPNPLLDSSTLSFVLIKPHAVHSGAEIEIRTFLERNRFTVVRTMRFLLTEDIIRRLVREHVLELSEGKIKAMAGMVCIFEVTCEENAIDLLWHLVGYEDPHHAKFGTLRRMYGVSLEHNAVYAPKTTETFKKLLGVFELWQNIFIQAMNSHDTEALAWAEEKFKEAFEQGKSEQVEPEPEEETSGDDGPVPASPPAEDPGGERDTPHATYDEIPQPASTVAVAKSYQQNDKGGIET